MEVQKGALYLLNIPTLVDTLKDYNAAQISSRLLANVVQNKSRLQR